MNIKSIFNRRRPGFILHKHVHPGEPGVSLSSSLPGQMDIQVIDNMTIKKQKL